MATQAQMDRLVGRALFDGDFRKLLLADPEKAARSLRIKLDFSQAQRIRSINLETLEQVVAGFRSATHLDRLTEGGFSFW